MSGFGIPHYGPARAARARRKVISLLAESLHDTALSRGQAPAFPEPGNERACLAAGWDEAEPARVPAPL